MFFKLSLSAIILYGICQSGQAQTIEKPPHDNPTLKSKNGYTGDKVLGSPEHGVKILHSVYQLIRVYMANHGGALPLDSGSLMVDVLNHPKVYSFADADHVIDALENPDDVFNAHSLEWDDPKRKSFPVIRFARPNGSLSSGLREPATIDVWAFTNTYFYENSPTIQDVLAGRKIFNPVGFYLVLRDDGQIERVPYDEVVFVYSFKTQGSSAMTLSPAFPQQAGVPYNCLSYQERWQAITSQAMPPVGTRVAQDTRLPIPDNGNIESLVQLSRLLNHSLERSAVWTAFDAAQKEFNLDDVQAGATKLHLPLVKEALTLNQLAKLRTPAIFLTMDDKRLVLLTSLSENAVIVVDRGQTHIVSWRDVEGRYPGEALISQAAAQGAPATLVADDAVRLVALSNAQLADPTLEIAQSVTLRNVGTQPLTIEIERPIPGVSAAELSSPTIAPGQTATLRLKLRWREPLKGQTQNVLVGIRTNDPIRPRLQLGFQLKRPQP